MIYIFGDSYCDPVRLNKNSSITWLNILKDHNYEIKNFGLSGTGPDFSLKIFNDLLVQNTFNENDLIIFILSSATRIDFPFSDNRYSYYATKFLINGQWWSQYKESIDHPIDFEKRNDYFDDKFSEFENRAKLNIKDFEEQILFYFETVGSNILFENYKNILYLKDISNQFNIKIITFPVFHLSSILKNCFVDSDFTEKIDYANFLQINYDMHEKFFDSIKIKSENNFKYVNFPLSKISIIQTIEEFKQTSKMNQQILNNHFTETNHKRFAKKILNVLENFETKIDFSEFDEYDNLKKISDVHNILKNINTAFIYE